MRRAESCQKLRSENVLPRPIYFVTQIRPRDIFHFHRAEQYGDVQVPELDTIRGVKQRRRLRRKDGKEEIALF